MNVTVSVADFLFANEALNCMTTYCPSGAPGRLVVALAEMTVRDTSLPKGLRTFSKADTHLSCVMAFRNSSEAWSQLWAYCPSSTVASQVCAAAVAAFCAPAFGLESGETDFDVPALVSVVGPEATPAKRALAHSNPTTWDLNSLIFMGVPWCMDWLFKSFNVIPRRPPLAIFFQHEGDGFHRGFLVGEGSFKLHDDVAAVRRARKRRQFLRRLYFSGNQWSQWFADLLQ